jgi:hypothetical protein
MQLHRGGGIGSIVVLIMMTLRRWANRKALTLMTLGRWAIPGSPLRIDTIFMTSAAASTSAKETIFLDSCASKGLLIVNNSNILDDMDSTVGVINLTKKGSSMATQGTGSKGSWHGITVCEDSINICAVDRLRTAGYGLVQLEEDHIVELQTRESVLKCKHKNGMPYVLLADLLSLPDISN